MVGTWSDYGQWAGNLDVGGSILKEIVNSRQHARRTALLIAAGILAAGVTPAQEVSENLYSGMKWRMIGPFRAGKVNAVAGMPGNPAVYYFAADGGGVWKTTDGGTVWKPIFDKEAVASIGAMALAPSNPNIIYVGTGVNTIFADSSYGDGVYKSLDGGENWQHAGLEDTGYRPGCGDGPQFWAQRRARSFPFGGRRADMEESPVQRQRYCCGGSLF